MSYSIIEVVINAARQKVLVQVHIPVYCPNLYITREMRKRSPNTQQAFLNHSHSDSSPRNCFKCLFLGVISFPFMAEPVISLTSLVP